jgi:peptidoglycan/LPS O-acetylase OafA/YrhL
VRRLFPALFSVLFVCAGVAAKLLLPRDLRHFGGSLLATTPFASNIFFWLEGRSAAMLMLPQPAN